MKFSISLFVVAAALSLPAQAASVPTELGQCVTTKIADIGTRLDGVPDSGDAVMYANGVVGISYSAVPGLHTAKVGDKVKLCLTVIPEDCPPDDDRGLTYAATDQRTGKTWELPNAGHMCGGA